VKRAIFTTGPWRTVEGDPASPSVVVGVPVTDVVLSRPDIAGALCLLVDERYAITGRLVTVGSARQLKRYLMRRLREDPAKAERAWHQVLLAELARRSPRPLLASRLASSRLARRGRRKRPLRAQGGPSNGEAV
jgi:hypothetical protein